MAESSSREEKLAAAKKKLQQFRKKRVANTKASETSNSSETISEETDSRVSAIPNEVPFPDKQPSELENSKTKSSSSLSVKSASKSDLVESSENLSSSSPKKSKSDLDLSASKELSSAESLRQISLQVNGLMSETSAFINGSIGDDVPEDLENQSLEKRNQELAHLVSNLRQSNDQLQFLLQDQKAKLKRQSQNFEQEKQQLLEKAHKEQVSLKDQLQVHIQTIGILVAEKTELQSSLSLSQQTAKQKAGEVEELQGRLRASRQRASDLERELISVTNSNQQLEKVKTESSKEIERLKLENYKLSKASEDFKSANVEVSEKLTKKINEVQSLENELAECRSKLSAAEVQAQQLSSESNSQQSGQLEDIYQQKLELEKRISLHKESIDKLINERDQMAEQYQQYIQQLSQQVTSLRDEIKQLSSEKELLIKDRDMLKEKLEALPNMYETASRDEELKLQINILENQKQELQQSLLNETENSTKLSQFLKESETKIEELEKTIIRLKDDQVDKTRLVETMQSDKIAASRAVAQNRELKKQLEELQQGFVNLTNDKMDLAEKLLSEQHVTKELGERLTQQEEELRELKDQLSDKETELQNLHKSNTKGIFQQNQIADRMRHYEAQGQLVEMLQKELHQAQEQISELTLQNSELRMAIATQAEVTASDECQKEDKDSSKRNDLVASLSASVRQLEMERNQMMKQLEEQKANRTNLEEQLKEKEMQFSENVNGNNDVVSKEEYNMIKKAMAQLEDRFKQTMNRIAELSDERQQLEHLVTQLQGETDTIGDYIALYQIQRSLMRKRASEKDEYIAQLARDREDMKAKLSELQSLVMRLLEERKMFQTQAGKIDQNVDNVGISPAEEVFASDESSVDVPNGTIDISDSSESIKKQGTARKIMELLSEIETTNLVEKPVLDSFHPCAVCSGKLITV